MQEIKETVFIAIAATTLAIVLGFVAWFGLIRSDLAEVKNAETQSHKTMIDYRRFNRYDDKDIYGEEVIELTKLYATEGIKIKVYSIPVNGIVEDIELNGEETLDDLQVLLQRTSSLLKFHSYLAYNEADLDLTAFPMKKIVNSEVIGVRIEYIEEISKE